MSESRVRKITHEVFGKDSWDKSLLLFAFVIGILGNIILKMLPIPVILPAIFSAAVIIGYVAWTYRSDMAKLEPEQIGDNAYYLGFILTLTSLSYTLYLMSSQRAESEFIADVISGFGIALSSTIVGVASRVYMQQFRLDLVARDQEARLAINQAMREFRTELSDSVRGMKVFGVELRQSLDEHHDATAKAHEDRLNQGLDTMIKRFDDTVKSLIYQNKASSKEMSDHAKNTIGTLYESTSKVLNRLESSISSTGQTVEESTEKMGQVVAQVLRENEKSLNLNSDQIKSSNELVTNAVSEFEKTIKHIMRDIEEDFKVSVSKSQEFSIALSDSTTGLHKTVSYAVESMDNLVGKINKQSDSISIMVEDRASQEGKVAEAINISMTDLSAEVRGFTNQVKTFSNNLDPVFSEIKAVLLKLQEIEENLLRKNEYEVPGSGFSSVDSDSTSSDTQTSDMSTEGANASSVLGTQSTQETTVQSDSATEYDYANRLTKQPRKFLENFRKNK